MRYVNNTIRAILLLAIGAVVQSCNDSVDDTIKAQSITLSVDAEITRTSDDDADEDTCYKTSFEHDDKFSLFAWSGDDEVSYNTLVANNVVYTYNYDAWFGADDIAFKDVDITHTISAIYPYTEASYIDQQKAIEYSSQSDVLFVKKQIIPSDGVITLEFDHVMSLLDIELEYKNFDPADLEGVTLRITAQDSSIVNAFTGEATGSGSSVLITISINDDSGEASRIMVPQSVALSAVSVVVGDRTYTYSGDNVVELESGKRTTCNLTIDKYFAEIGVASVETAGWDSGDSYDFGNAVESQI